LAAFAVGNGRIKKDNELKEDSEKEITSFGQNATE
jgi:hypothetical protein